MYWDECSECGFPGGYFSYELGGMFCSGCAYQRRQELEREREQQAGSEIQDTGEDGPSKGSASRPRIEGGRPFRLWIAEQPPRRVYVGLLRPEPW